MKVWNETEIQEMLLNQHFLDFPFMQTYKHGYDSTLQNYSECVI